MAITYIASISNPVDNGTLAGPTVDIIPPTNMFDGDLCILVASYKATGVTLTILEEGGQVWTAGTQFTNASGITGRIFWTRFNGTWGTNPSVTVISGILAMSVALHVFRSTVPVQKWDLDADEITGTFAAPLTPFDITGPGITTTTAGALVFGTTHTSDDNTWALQTAGWANAGTAQYRNLSGQDLSFSCFYKIQETPGATGQIVNRQVTNGGDAGAANIIAFRAVAQLAVPVGVAGNDLLVEWHPTGHQKLVPQMMISVKMLDIFNHANVTVDLSEESGKQTYFPDVLDSLTSEERHDLFQKVVDGLVEIYRARRLS